MEYITHLINSIESFSKLNFKFSQYFQILNPLVKIPDAVSHRLNNIDVIHHLEEASKYIDWLNSFFEDKINPITKKELSKLKSSKNKDVQIPYADFKIDKPPIFRDELIKQISFEDIIREGYLKPVKRRSHNSFTFKSVCPYCGAPKKYIYDNSRGRCWNILSLPQEKTHFAS